MSEKEIMPEDEVALKWDALYTKLHPLLNKHLPADCSEEEQRLQRAKGYEIAMGLVLDFITTEIPHPN